MYASHLDSNDAEPQCCEDCEKEFDVEDWGHSRCVACRTEHAIAVSDMLADNAAQRRQVAMMERDRACGRTVVANRSHRIAQDAMGPAPLT